MSVRRLLASLLSFLLFSVHLEGAAQCITRINTFPYTADFELTDDGWQTGGLASDWVWGIPRKPVISAAASGQRCWVTGGLQYTAYNDNENSWLMSPCFDFTSLPNPYIRFQVFWETERKYDGATFEYSTDGGSSWAPLGSNADYQSCPGSNWFNTQAITTTGTDGWSGNAQATSPCPGGAGYGSTQWVTAGRAMPQLAGRDNVRFRFRFAAGNRCNSYDGFAVDNIWIGEVQPLSAEFTYKCSSDRSGQFTPATIGCGSNYSWNFGDPASGSANTTTGVSPVHTFSSAGDYLVTLTVNTSTGGASTITKPVRVLDANVQVVTPVGCVGDSNGVLSVQASPAGSYTYGWSTDPVQTGVSASGLPSGNYSVEIRGTNVCTVRAAGTLTDPVPLAHTQTVSDARCTGPNGKAAILPTGGTGPYSFSWSPAGGSSASSAVLVPGDYTVAISDAHGCPDTARFTIGDNSGLPLTLGRDTVLCAGETLLLVPAPGPFTSFTWQDGRNTPDYRVVQTGSYSVRVADADGCSASASVKVTVDCSDVFFPSAFTPNGDGRNDYFGPLGNRSALSEYSLKVFGRWGQVVFETTNPFGRWNGNTTSGKDGSQVYVWVARYRLVRHDGVQTRKGTITLVR